MLVPYLQKGDKSAFRQGLGVMATWLRKLTIIFQWGKSIFDFLISWPSSNRTQPTIIGIGDDRLCGMTWGCPCEPAAKVLRTFFFFFFATFLYNTDAETLNKPLKTFKRSSKSESNLINLKEPPKKLNKTLQQHCESISSVEYLRVSTY